MVQVRKLREYKSLQQMGVLIEYKDVRCSQSARFKAYVFHVPDALLPAVEDVQPDAASVVVPAHAKVH